MNFLCPCSRTPRTTHQNCWERSLAFNNALQRNNTMHLGHVWLCAHRKTRYQKPSILRTAGTQALSLSLNPSITQ
ncbi:hypothetical protein HZ326_17936 [Fusarium oxysporum f. sp. albedinis]|nr:hypothetical protein HZ326_17936 [Fusarium oxysporum f. sp. albedinis]